MCPVATVGPRPLHFVRVTARSSGICLSKKSLALPRCIHVRAGVRAHLHLFERPAVAAGHQGLKQVQFPARHDRANLLLKPPINSL